MKKTLVIASVGAAVVGFALIIVGSSNPAALRPKAKAASTRRNLDQSAGIDSSPSAATVATPQPQLAPPLVAAPKSAVPIAPIPTGYAPTAADYVPDQPRRRNELGQALPFREAKIPAQTMDIIRNARNGAFFGIELFPGVSFRARVTGRWDDATGTRVAARLEGRSRDQGLFASWYDGGSRVLIELPSENIAYEIVPDSSEGYVVREWLYKDIVCAGVSGDTKAVSSGLPRATNKPLRSIKTVDISQIPQLSSNPRAVAVIYLDFDGETVSGSKWLNGATIVAPPATMDGFYIKEAWQRVVRDFETFDVNVTTMRSVYDAAPINRKTHCIVTPNDAASPGAGGVAYVDTFDSSDPGYKVCWVFEDEYEKSCAEAASHEVGHTLGLNHDGRNASGSEPREEYYHGHGFGETGWAPIMGAGYYRELTQWAKDEYPNANNPEDDLAIITVATQAPYLADQGGDWTNTATAVAGDYVQGKIERDGDADYFSLQLPAGNHTITAYTPAYANLDINLFIRDANNNTIASANPVDGLNASASFSLGWPQKIYVRITGTGKGNPLETGYSSYGSIGSYMIGGFPFQAMPQFGLLETVLVDDAGNAASTWTDAVGKGSVAYDYGMGKYEVTIEQYAAFLNAVAATNTNSYIVDLWNPAMASDWNVAGISRSGSGVPGDPYVYSIVGSGRRPIAYVNWFGAARFANWMHNSHRNSADTETGAYTLNGATNGIIARNPGALWFVPNDNEWIKAGHYKSDDGFGNGTNAGYWLFPTRSNTGPGNLIGSAPNQGNVRANNVYSVTQSSNYNGFQPYLTDVGAYSGSPSPYGTYDQCGNLWEWTETIHSDPNFPLNLILKGNDWQGSNSDVGGAGGSQIEDRISFTGNVNSAKAGFRLACRLEQNNGAWTYTLEDGKAHILRYTGPGGSVVVPTELAGCPVTQFGTRRWLGFGGRGSHPWMDSRYGWSTIFTNTTNVTAITIPIGITNILREAFYTLRGLTNVSIPEGVQAIGERAFDRCTNLPRITLPTTVESIGEAAFEDCSKLSSIVIPELVTSISRSAFNRCTGLTNVSIPAGVTQIEGSAFGGCTNLASVNLPANLAALGEGAFYGCTKLGNVTLPPNLVSIGASAFAYCGPAVFACPIHPDVVSQIPSECPYHYPEVQYLELVPGSSRFAHISIPDSVSYVGERAFQGSGLTNLSIGAGVTYMRPDYCPVLQRIEVSSLNPVYRSDNGVLVDKTLNRLVWFPASHSSSYSIPSGLTSIGENAFGARSLVSVSIPATVTNIEAGAFYGCRGLTEVAIPGSVKTIGADAFSFCTGLTKITLTEGLQAIGDRAFAFSSDQSFSSVSQQLIIPHTVTDIGSGAFFNRIFEGVVFGSGLTNVADGAFGHYGFNFQQSPTLVNSVFFTGGAPGPSYYDFLYRVGIDTPEVFRLSGAAGWADGDGSTEFSPASGPAAYAVPGGFSFGWEGTGSLPMNVQRATSPAGPWQTIAANNALRSFTDTNPPSGKAFYRAASPISIPAPDALVYRHPTLGPILTDNAGRVLYFFYGDIVGGNPAYSGPTWPYAGANASTRRGKGVTATLASSTYGTPSGPYLTVNGRPVYRFSGDTAPGQANGQGLGSVWWTITPDGIYNQ